MERKAFIYSSHEPFPFILFQYFFSFKTILIYVISSNLFSPASSSSSLLIYMCHTLFLTFLFSSMYTCSPFHILPRSTIHGTFFSSLLKEMYSHTDQKCKVGQQKRVGGGGDGQIRSLWCKRLDEVGGGGG